MTSLDDLTTKCIRCGFCLEACPTFTETGKETESPRGRIYLMRSAAEGKLQWSQDDVGQFVDGCLGCRACETACPSGVEYGKILELGRKELNRSKGTFGVRLLLSVMTHPSLLKLQIGLGRLWLSEKLPWFISRLLTREKPEAALPRAEPLLAWPELAEDDLPPVRGRVYLLEGCAMRVLFPNVHVATRRLLRRVGFVVEESSAGCCGALHAHQGFLSGGLERLAGVSRAMALDIPVVVNSAGCGSFMLEHGGEISSRVVDASKFLFENGLADLLRESRGFVAGAPTSRLSKSGDRSPQSKTPSKTQSRTRSRTPSRTRSTVTVAYHDACHLINGQKVFLEPRALLEGIPEITLVALSEADTCCGSAGIYNLTQPKMARQLLERKWRQIEASGCEIVALGNPGCHAWIGQAAREHGDRVRVMHTVEVLEESLSGGN